MKKCPLFISLLAIFACAYAHAESTFDVKFASAVIPYQDGYLLKIGGIQDNRDFQSYSKLITQQTDSTIYIPIDTVDYSSVKLVYNFTLSDSISLFGAHEREYLRVKGNRLFLGYTGQSGEIENVLVFIPASEIIRGFQPIWGKNYELVDSCFSSVDKAKLSVTAHNDSTLYKKIRKRVLSVLLAKVKERKSHLTYDAIARLLHLNIYRVSILSWTGASYLVIANGVTKDKKSSFDYAVLLNEDLETIEIVAPALVANIEDRYYEGPCPIYVYDIYHSNRLGKDIVLCGIEKTGKNKYLLYEYQGGLRQYLLYHEWYDP